MQCSPACTCSSDLPCTLSRSCWQVQELPLLIAFGSPLLAIALFRMQVHTHHFP